MEKKFGSSNLLMSVIEIIIGILLLIDPKEFTSGIIMVFGIILAVVGAQQIVKYFRSEIQAAIAGGFLTKGILFLLGGLFCAFNSNWFIDTFPVITLVYGIIILVTGVSKLQEAVNMLRAKQKFWFVALIRAALTLAFASLIIGDPFSDENILWIFIGISLIVEAGADVLSFIFAKKS